MNYASVKFLGQQIDSKDTNVDGKDQGVVSEDEEEVGFELSMAEVETRNR